METVITTVAIDAVIPAVFLLIYMLRLRDEKKRAPDAENRIIAPKSVLWFFAVVSIFFYVISIIAAVSMTISGEPFSTVAIALSIFALFTIMGLFGLLYARFRYTVYDDEKVTNYLLFSKPRTFYYKDIAYYNFSGDFKAYDENGVKLFSQESIYVGFGGLISRMNENGVKNVAHDYFVKNMKDNKIFANYKRRTLAKVAAWTTFAIGLMMLALFGLTFGSADYVKFENYIVHNTVVSFETQNEGFSVKLDNDDNEYHINNIIYDALDKSIITDIKEGDEITLYVGYVDSRGRRVISQLELDGKVYLHAADAEKAEKDNYDKLIITSYVFLGLSAAFIAMWIAFSILAYRKTH